MSLVNINRKKLFKNRLILHFNPSVNDLSHHAKNSIFVELRVKVRNQSFFHYGIIHCHFQLLINCCLHVLSRFASLNGSWHQCFFKFADRCSLSEGSSRLFNNVSDSLEHLLELRDWADVRFIFILKLSNLLVFFCDYFLESGDLLICREFVDFWIIHYVLKYL